MGRSYSHLCVRQSPDLYAASVHRGLPLARPVPAGMLEQMFPTHHCARCQHEFVADSDKPSCPSCGRGDLVEPAKASDLMRDIRRQWLAVLVLLIAVSVGYVIFELTNG